MKKTKFVIAAFAVIGAFLMLSMPFVQPVTAMKTKQIENLKTCDEIESSVQKIAEDKKILALAEKISEKKELIEIQSKITEDTTEEELNNIAIELANALEKQPEYKQVISYIEQNYGQELDAIRNNFEDIDEDTIIFLLRFIACVLAGIGIGFDLLSTFFKILPGFWIAGFISELIGGAFLWPAAFLSIIADWLAHQEEDFILQRPFGKTRISLDKTCDYSTLAIHPSGKDIKYGWDWDGDKKVDEWTDFYKSGEKVTVSHKFTTRYSGQIRVRILDETGGLSPWSDPLKVSISRYKSTPLSKIKNIFDIREEQKQTIDGEDIKLDMEVAQIAKRRFKIEVYIENTGNKKVIFDNPLWFDFKVYPTDPDLWPAKGDLDFYKDISELDSNERVYIGSDIWNGWMTISYFYLLMFKFPIRKAMPEGGYRVCGALYEEIPFEDNIFYDAIKEIVYLPPIF